MSNANNNRVHILILTAVSTEYTAVRKHLNHLKDVKDPVTKNWYEVGKFQNYDIAIREASQGNYQMSVEAERAIKFFEPKLVLLVGIAGSRKEEKVTYGDVIIVNRVYSIEAGKETPEGFKSREKGGPTQLEMVEEARRHGRKKDWLRFTSHKDEQYKVVVGAIASGEKVVGNSTSHTAELIALHSEDAIAIEMEGLGLATVMHAYPHIKNLQIRSISDLLDKKDEEYDAGHRELAAENATAFAFQVISEMDWADLIKPSTNEKTPRTHNDNRTYDNRRTIHTDNYIENNEGIVNIGVKKNFQDN